MSFTTCRGLGADGAALVLTLLAAPFGPAAASGRTAISRELFGRLVDGTAVDRYTLTNRNGIVCKIITYGATITELHVPDRTGRMADIVLGHADLPGYLGHSPYLGAVIGRVANRIAAGRFTLDGTSYRLATNDGPNHLHGGIKGFDKVLWQARIVRDDSLQLSYTSRDGEEGYPGTLMVTVTYRLTNDDQLRIEYAATSDKATPINLTNHTYWNLAGGGGVLGHVLTLRASHFTPVDRELIPTGQIAAVAGGPMDFQTPKEIGRDLSALDNQPQGYDHNFVLDAGRGAAAELYDPASGRALRVSTTEPGIQFYSGNFLDGSIVGKYGIVYRQHEALCLETQHFPDALHHPEFPSIVLRPGETYRSTTSYAFSTR
jgi:aldose 1-epimerase